MKNKIKAYPVKQAALHHLMPSIEDLVDIPNPGGN